MSGTTPVKHIVAASPNRLAVTNATANSNGDYAITTLPNGANGQTLTLSGGAPTWQNPTPGALAEGNVFIGNASSIAIATKGTAQGQVLQAGAGPDFFSIFASLSASYVTFSPTLISNITATNVGDALNEVASERAYPHSSPSNPTINNDTSDTAAIGIRFKRGDSWINTGTNAAYICVDSSTGAAVWTRTDIAGLSSVFNYKGTLNPAVDPLPTTPASGDYYKMVTASGDFGGAFTPGLNINDAIVYNGTSWDRIDNTDPAVSGTDIIDVTGNGTIGYTVSMGGWSGLANGRILTRVDADNVGELPLGTAGQVLRRNLAGTNYEFVTLASTSVRVDRVAHSGGSVTTSTHTYTGFFTNAPIANSVSISMNGVMLDPLTDFTVTGTNLTLDVDAIGVQLDNGDRIVGSSAYTA